MRQAVKSKIKSYSYVKNLKNIIYCIASIHNNNKDCFRRASCGEGERGLLIVLPSKVTLDRMYNIYLLKCTCIQNNIELRKSILYPKGVLLQQQPSGHFSS